MTIYFSIIIIGILDYLQKYYKITWLKNTLGPIICIRFAITNHQFLTGCMKPLIFGWLYEAINQWYSSTCIWCWNLFKVQWLRIRFSANFIKITHTHTHRHTDTHTHKHTHIRTHARTHTYILLAGRCGIGRQRAAQPT